MLYAAQTQYFKVLKIRHLLKLMFTTFTCSLVAPNVAYLQLGF